MRNIYQLHPRLQFKLKELQAMAAKDGLQLGIGECLRTVEEQDALYAQGRTTPGSIVTYARGSSYSSQHQWGIAFDFYKDLKGHAYDDEIFFKTIGRMAKNIGLAWGGDWTSPVDMPHIYLPDWGDTPAPLKKIYGTPDRFFESWSKTDSSLKLDIDGYWGKATTTRLQMIFHTPIDGIVSDQWIQTKRENPGIVSSFEWVENPTEGSALIKAIQLKVGAYPDGILGDETIRAMQKWLRTPVDGVLDSPSTMIRALQKWCNEQT